MTMSDHTSARAVRQRLSSLVAVVRRVRAVQCDDVVHRSQCGLGDRQRWPFDWRAYEAGDVAQLLCTQCGYPILECRAIRAVHMEARECHRPGPFNEYWQGRVDAALIRCGHWRRVWNKATNPCRRALRCIGMTRRVQPVKNHGRNRGFMKREMHRG